jgi:glucose uptake protein GlcU
MMVHLLADITSGFTTGLPHADANGSQLQTILQIVFGILAALETSKARNTIVYALIGLLVAMVAEALVSFVLGKL